MTPLRVALFPADKTGCGHYRMHCPAAAAGEQIEAIWPQAGSRNLLKIATGQLDVDAVVFQRPANRTISELIPVLQGRGVAIVVELDDDLGACHPRSDAFREYHPSANPRISWHNIKRAVRLADLVTVTTPALAARYGGRKARVLPNCVPTSLLEIHAPRDGRTIGWGGLTTTHIGDLAVTRGGVAQAIADTDARFLAVGPSIGVKQDLSLPAEPDATGSVDFQGYHQALAQLDVTIAPLADSQFNRAKSGLKVLEAAALGVPCVASPRPEYELLAEEGLTLLAADRARDWRRQCKQLLLSAAARTELASRAREAVRDRHLYEDNGWRWTEAWHEAVRIRRTSPVMVAA